MPTGLNNVRNHANVVQGTKTVALHVHAGTDNFECRFQLNDFALNSSLH